jgi:hypothetical protein
MKTTLCLTRSLVAAAARHAPLAQRCAGALPGAALRPRAAAPRAAFRAASATHASFAAAPKGTNPSLVRAQRALAPPPSATLRAPHPSPQPHPALRPPRASTRSPPRHAQCAPGAHCAAPHCAQEYRVFLKSGDTVVSPWHDVPLHADKAKGLLNFICEIPKETKAKARAQRAGRAARRGAREPHAKSCCCGCAPHPSH